MLSCEDLLVALGIYLAEGVWGGRLSDGFMRHNDTSGFVWAAFNAMPMELVVLLGWKKRHLFIASSALIKTSLADLVCLFAGQADYI